MKSNVVFKVLSQLFKGSDTVSVLYDLTESVLLEITKNINYSKNQEKILFILH